MLKIEPKNQEIYEEGKIALSLIFGPDSHRDLSTGRRPW